MNNHKIEVTEISEPLLRLIDQRVQHFGGDRSAYIRDLIEKDILSTSHGQEHTLVELVTKHAFDSQQWETDMKLLAQRAEEIPVLPPEAFTRENIYGNHD